MRPIVLLAVAAALAVAGCGGGENKNAGSNSSGGTTSGGGGEQIALAAPSDGSLKFDQTTLNAKAGKITINFDNPSSTPHAVEVEGNGVEQKSDTVTGGKTSVTVDVKPGTYEFYCPVDGHRAAGMEGKLIVK